MGMLAKGRVSVGRAADGGMFGMAARLGPEIVESHGVRDFQLNFKTNCKLISDLPSCRLSEVVRWPAFKCARCHPSASE